MRIDLGQTYQNWPVVCWHGDWRKKNWKREFLFLFLFFFFVSLELGRNISVFWVICRARPIGHWSGVQSWRRSRCVQVSACSFGSLCALQVVRCVGDEGWNVSYRSAVLTPTIKPEMPLNGRCICRVFDRWMNRRCNGVNGLICWM